MEQRTREIEARLREAIDGGEVLDIIYQAGSQPGTLREIAPISINHEKVRARCYSSHAVKSFFIDKIIIVDGNDKPDVMEWKEYIKPLPPLPRFIYALGIKGVGERRAVVLAERFKTMEAFRMADFGELLNLYDIGPLIASSIVEFFRGSNATIEEYRRVGIRPPLPPPATEGPFKELTFLFTGTLEEYSRDEAKRLVLSAGGTIASSPSIRVDYLVVGKKPGVTLPYNSTSDN